MGWKGKSESEFKLRYKVCNDGRNDDYNWNLSNRRWTKLYSPGRLKNTDLNEQKLGMIINHDCA